MYDAFGRLGSETNPESGTTKYNYDAFTSACSNSAWNANAPGTLAQSQDANGNILCFYRDSLGRIATIWPTNCNSSTAPNKAYTHDVAIGTFGQSPPAGANLQNIVGRLVEAETDDCAWPRGQSDLITDEWFSYDADGRVTDVWEMTPHSSGYYHTTVTYNPNGTVASINGIPSYTAYTFGIDGEGRPYTTSQGTATLINGVSYDAAGSVLTALIGGSGDNDKFTYDTVERTKSYTFAVKGNLDSGGLVWNQNGSLRYLAVNDSFNTAGSQSCAFSYDDLARLVMDACGGENIILNQGFEIGNIDWILAGGWSIVNNPSNAQSGNYYLSGTSTTDTASVATTNGSNRWMPVTPGSLVQYGGWVNRVSGTGYASWGCEVVDSNYNLVTWCNTPAGITDRTTGPGWNYYHCCPAKCRRESVG